MRFLIAGASGFLGSRLRDSLVLAGHDVTALVRREPGAGQAQWDPYAGRLDLDLVEKADVVVNLAGAPTLGNPHSKRWATELRDSRVTTTRVLAEAIATSGRRPDFLAGNGISFYGDRGDEVLTEASSGGRGFLADVVGQWEAAADPARAAGLRVVHLRTGPVQTAAGAGLPKQALMFRLGIGGRLGSGRQWLSWISLDDVAGAYLHALTRQDLEGPVNAVAPNPVTNAEFTATLARILRRPAFLHVPAFAPRLVLGEAADELLFVSQRALPARLRATGYRFQLPELEPALRQTLGRP
jgi:uncharacterized protein (TIGR01777 family)